MRIRHILLIGLAGLISTAQVFAQSQTQTNNTDVESQQTKLMTNWDEFSFASFEPIQEGGSIGTEFNEKVGWDVSRSWEAGDSIEDILKVGDLQGSLSPHLFSLEDIYRKINQRNEIEAVDTDGDGLLNQVPSDITLADYPLATGQTIESLVESIPELQDYKANEVAPIQDLLEANGYEDLDTDIGTLLEEESGVGELELDSVELEEYSVEEIPNLSNTQIEDMEGFEEMNISEIPGLSELSLSDFPNSINAGTGIVARVDMIWGDAETDKNQTISGSIVEGFRVACQDSCAHLELDDIENFGAMIQLPFEGNQWIRGRNPEHWVAGGTGCWSGGREPTGIHPFGNTFKAVLWGTQEARDTAQIVAFFNIKTKCGESPYFIGPLPYPQGQVKVNDWIFLGTGI